MRNSINRFEKTIKRQNRNAFIKGMGSILEIMPLSKPYRISTKTVILTDNETLADSWRKVGEYMRWALNEISEKIDVREK